MDKTKILEVLNDWNYWNRELPKTKKRPYYDEKLTSFLKYDEISVIKGIRRSGKSTLMLNQIKQLLQDGVHRNDILIVNLEDPRFINHLDIELLQTIKDVYLEYLNPRGMPYLFLDEIQNIPHWEKWVNKEYELKQSKIMVTGSNSSMLSREIASTLSGRYLSLEVYPLSFQEYLYFVGIDVVDFLSFAHQKIEINRAFEQYIKYGGFPKLIAYEDREKKELLNTYKDTILLKDIVARYRLKHFKILEDIAAFLLSNTGIIQSISRLKNHFNISHDMASSYVEYLQNAYVLFDVKKFDYSLRKQNVNDKKYYSADLGLSNLYRAPNLQTRGQDLETIVFLELKRRGYVVYYYKTSNDLECDFVVEEENRIVMLMQVSKTLENKKTQKREINALLKTAKELNLEDQVKLLIVTEDATQTIEEDRFLITVVNILEWLCEV